MPQAMSDKIIFESLVNVPFWLCMTIAVFERKIRNTEVLYIELLWSIRSLLPLLSQYVIWETNPSNNGKKFFFLLEFLTTNPKNHPVFKI
jgi:hypothetical protein